MNALSFALELAGRHPWLVLFAYLAACATSVQLGRKDRRTSNESMVFGLANLIILIIALPILFMVAGGILLAAAMAFDTP